MTTPILMSPKRKWLRRFLQLTAFLLFLWLMIQTSMMVVIHFYGLAQQATQPADAIVILGAGVNRDGRAGFALTRRSEAAIALYQDGLAPLMLCTGGIPYNRPRSEAKACRDVLLAQNIPDEAILREEQSHSTEENALYSTPLLAENGIQRIIVVSDSFHLLRAGYLFGSRGLDVQLEGVPPQRSRTSLDYFLSLAREGVALQWQLVKDLFGLPFTRVPLI